MPLDDIGRIGTARDPLKKTDGENAYREKH